MEDIYCKSIYCSGHASMMIVCLCKLDEKNDNVLLPFLNFESHSSHNCKTTTLDIAVARFRSQLFLKPQHYERNRQ